LICRKKVVRADTLRFVNIEGGVFSRRGEDRRENGSKCNSREGGRVA